MGIDTHRAKSPRTVRVGIVSVSTTRRLADDHSGHWIRKRAADEGHRVVLHQVVGDDAHQIRSTVTAALADGGVDGGVDAMILTGGTGVSPQDVTVETLQPLFVKELSGFGTLFAMLSYEQIQAAAILSRATAGIIGQTVVFCLPGSLNACRLACEALIFPELGHLVGHLRG